MMSLWLDEKDWRASGLVYLLGCCCKISLSVLVPLTLWLRVGDSEATPGGLIVALYGFVASILGTAYRIYFQVTVDAFLEEPVTLVAVLALALIRWLMLRYFRRGPRTKAARVTRAWLLCLWVLLTIVVPAFILTGFQIRPDECAEQAEKDPIWTPSF